MNRPAQLCVFFYSNDIPTIRRQAVACQIWLGRAFLDEKLSLSVGGGFRYLVDRYRQSTPEELVPKRWRVSDDDFESQFLPYQFLRRACYKRD